MTQATLESPANGNGPTSAEPCIHLDPGALHDLAGPVNQLCSMSELLLARHGSQLDTEAQILVSFIRSSAGRLQNLVGGLRTYSQTAASPATLRACDGGLLLEAAQRAVHPAIVKSGARVTHDSLHEINADPGQMAAVFAALIDNAIKFRGEDPPAIHVSSASDGETLVYRFHDNGIGIDPRHHQRIFGVFARVHKDDYPGAGIGLAIARRIMEEHGGRIWVESRLGRGATFYLSLPAHARIGAP